MHTIHSTHIAYPDELQSKELPGCSSKGEETIVKYVRRNLNLPLHLTL